MTSLRRRFKYYMQDLGIPDHHILKILSMTDQDTMYRHNHWLNSPPKSEPFGYYGAISWLTGGTISNYWYEELNYEQL